MKTIKQMLRHMLELQLYNDEQVHKKFGTSYSKILDNNGFFWALTDEVGEWIHELKGNWCWWKESQAPVNKAKALEEFVDGVHFILSFCLAVNNKDIDKCCVYDEGVVKGHRIELTELIISILQDVNTVYVFADPFLNISDSQIVIEDLLLLIDHMGYTFEEVYEAYKEKNKVNLERVAGHY